MKRVTGVGGIFFKCEDPDRIKEWYNKHLDLETDAYGTCFESRKSDNPDVKTYLQWSPFKNDTTHFEPSQKDHMINYTVENLEALVPVLKEEDVTICDEIQTFDYGKFVHILDPEGNKIELWEPIHKEFEKIVDGKTS